jgi:hypothetical protein
VTSEMKVEALGALEKLAKGGTATIYRVPDIEIGLGPMVYKEYFDKTREHAGKEAMTAGLRRFVRFRETLAPRQRMAWDARIVWPVCLVLDDDGTASGILMPLIPRQYFHSLPKSSGGTHEVVLNLDLLFGALDDPPAKHLSPMSVSDRLGIVSGVAHAYGLMHRADVVLGDVSGFNVVFNPTVSPPSVLVIDVDSVRLVGNRPLAGNQAHTPGWEPPEALDALAAARTLRQLNHSGGSADEIRRKEYAWSIQTPATDVYKFGLMVTRLLDNRRGGSKNRDPGKAITVLRREGLEGAARLLARSLDDKPDTRPKMREWYEALGGKRSSKSQESSEAGKKKSGGIPDGTRKGVWVWKEGTGWVRAEVPAKGTPHGRGRSASGGQG